MCALINNEPFFIRLNRILVGAFLLTSVCSQLLYAQSAVPRPLTLVTPRTDTVRPGRFDDYPRQSITRAPQEPTPFYGRCNYNFDGALVCVKFPGKGESRCSVTADCYTPTPTPLPTVIRTPTPTPTPKLSCICACRSPAVTRELFCSQPFTYRVSRMNSVCPDKESGWYPWAFERDSLAVPATRSAKYCADRWDGKEGMGFSVKSPNGPSQKCILEQCREGLLRRAWPE